MAAPGSEATTVLAPAAATGSQGERGASLLGPEVQVIAEHLRHSQSCWEGARRVLGEIQELLQEGRRPEGSSSPARSSFSLPWRRENGRLSGGGAQQPSAGQHASLAGQQRVSIVAGDDGFAPREPGDPDPDQPAPGGEHRASVTGGGRRNSARRSVTSRRTSLRRSSVRNGPNVADCDTDTVRSESKASAFAEDENSDDNIGEDVDELPYIYPPPRRRMGVSAEAHGAYNQRRASYAPPKQEHSAELMQKIKEGLRVCPFFRIIEDETLEKIANTMELETYADGQKVISQGDFGRSGYLLLEGRCDAYDDSVKGEDGRGRFVRAMPKNRFFGEMTMLWGLRRTMSVYATGEKCVLAKLKRDNYLDLVMREEMKARNKREELLRKVEMFETLSDEHIAQIADALERKTFHKDQVIIQQGEQGQEFYVVLNGTCKATIRTGSVSEKADIQEHQRYGPGDLFGERALLHRTTRAATITAVTDDVEVLCLKRSRFERMLGPLAMLNQKNYLCDPRKSIADFYRVGDHRGPRGSFNGQPDLEHKTSWFAVYRPTSRDAIAKMLSGKAVGKGLNVKGKSAKKNQMSGFVPYLQISKNEHKYKLEESNPDAYAVVYYSKKAERELAVTNIEGMVEGAGKFLKEVDRYEPHAFGLYLPERILRQAYILTPDIAFLSGWETGRQSEPAFMDMNLHAVTGESEPDVVLFQQDSENVMNPHALLIAYAEDKVKPVVSDFDTFTVGSRGMSYEPLPPQQQSLAVWALDNTKKILSSKGAASWNSRWLEVLKEASEQGFHPEIPKYGFGDKTSYRLIEAVIAATRESGAVRHGAECFNFYFPQELDDEYLVVWEGFPDKPWGYMDEDDLRFFLLDRAEEGFSFPLNPIWPVRDDGWYDVYSALWENEETRPALESWYPQESGIRELVEAIHEAFPQGFEKLLPEDDPSGKDGGAANRISVMEDLDSCERADLALERTKILSRARRPLRKVQLAAKVLSRLRPAGANASQAPAAPSPADTTAPVAAAADPGADVALAAGGASGAGAAQ